MKTITIKQPWASLIVEPDTENLGFGIKPIENRTWPCPPKHIGKRVLVHASKSWTKSSAEICVSIAHVKEALERLGMIHKYDDESIGYKGYSFSGLTCGAIIGSVEIVDFVVNHPSIWAEKTNIMRGDKPTYNWVLANGIKFPEPIPVKGKLNFWDYPNILAEPEEEGGRLYCHCQLSVDERAQVSSFGGGYLGCRYCHGIWYK